MQRLWLVSRAVHKSASWTYDRVGGDRPSDVLEQAKVRKEQGFTRVKMNATESIGWLDSPHALDETVQRLADIKSLGIDAGL